MHKFNYILFIFLFVKSTFFAQQKTDDLIFKADTIAVKINPLAPAKAAFYSAVVPGLGQAYNKKYWKIPLVYGALGTTVYFFITNNKKYNTFRDVYKRRLEGFTDDDYRYLDDSRLIQAQKFYQNNRDLSALLTGLFYILNIVDANVDAHFMQFNVNNKLTLKPEMYKNDGAIPQILGVAMIYNF